MEGDGLELKSPEAKENYQEGITILKDAVQLKKPPDRFPGDLV